MKKTVCALLVVLLSSGCSNYMQDTITAQCNFPLGIGNGYSQKDTLTKLIDQYSKTGSPGLAISIYTPAEGYWGAASGYAKIETKKPMQLYHLQCLQRAVEMYMAAVILKVNEEKQMDWMRR